MDSAFNNLDAAGFLQIWQYFDADDNGYIEGKELDDFFRHMLKKLSPGAIHLRLDLLYIKTRKNCMLRFPIFPGDLGKRNLKLELSDEVTEKKVEQLKRRFMSAYDVTADGRLQIQELANMMLPEDENFLLLFRREAPLDSSVEFMKIWRKYDTDSSGYISAVELKGFLKDLFAKHKKVVSSSKLDEYTDAMMNIFDKNKDGRLDLNDLARILALQENFLLQFQMDACSQEERKRDFEKIFSYYDVSKTGALEGPEVDGFVKDMMELVKPSISGPELDKLRVVLLRHCDVNNDGKIQRNELALCLGLKFNQ